MQATNFLKNFNLSVTESRLAILNIFMDADGALAHNDIEKKTQSIFDRATVYRTLQTFVDKGIIHQIPTTDNSVLYAMCKERCGEGHHHDNHVHFLCSVCDVTVCLDTVIVPEVKLPKGFRQEDVKMIVTGVCKSCR